MGLIGNNVKKNYFSKKLKRYIKGTKYLTTKQYRINYGKEKNNYCSMGFLKCS